MNINQKQTILDILQKIQNINIEALFLEAYPDITDFKNAMIAKFSCADFIFLIDKLLKRFKTELEGKYALLLPATENYSNDFGTVNLKQDLQNLYSHIIAKQFEAAESNLEKLIHYQIKNDIWNKADKKTQTVDNDFLKEQLVLIEINQKALNKSIETFAELKLKFEQEIISANNIILAKKNELNEIIELLSIAKSNINSISELTSSASNKEIEISGILKNLNEKVNYLSESVENKEERFAQIETELNELGERLNITVDNAKSNLAEINTNLAFVTSKKKEIETLTGMAADGSLGSKFDQRKKDLTTSVRNWTFAVILVTILAATWIYLVFAVLYAKLSNEWINLLVNILKTSPAFVLVGFVFSRYSKERTLEEEYAFKSAIAMTLTAYSQMLASEDTENNVSRQQMLTKSIEMIYTQPHLYSEKSDSFTSNSVTQIKETLDSLTEAIKRIKD